MLAISAVEIAGKATSLMVQCHFDAKEQANARRHTKVLEKRDELRNLPAAGRS